MPKLLRLALAVAVLPSPFVRAEDDPVTKARALMRQGEYRRALVVLTPALDADKKNVPGQLTAAAACLGLGDPDCADKHLKVVDKLTTDAPGYQLLRGRMLLLRADRAAEESHEEKQVAFATEGAEAFTKALVESPGPATLSFLAMAQRAARQPEAKATYLAWLAAAPRDPNAYGATAAFLAESGNWSEAEAIASRAPQDDPRLAHEIRLAVMRNGMTVVPWETIRPFFDAVEAEETDPATQRALRAYRTIRTSQGRRSLLAVLDYLDADPEDHLELKPTLKDRIAAEMVSNEKEGVTLPEIVRTADPRYPDVPRRARIEGKVVLLARVGTDGRIGSLHVIATSNPMFNESALEAVRRWVYKPATVHGEPIEMPYMIRVDYRLR